MKDKTMAGIIDRCLKNDMFATAVMVSLMRPPKKNYKKAKRGRKK